jgi:hypothetical protein
MTKPNKPSRLGKQTAGLPVHGLDAQSQEFLYPDLVRVLQELQLPIEQGMKGDLYNGVVSPKACQGPCSPKENRESLNAASCFRGKEARAKAPRFKTPKCMITPEKVLQASPSKQEPPNRILSPISWAALPIYLQLYDVSNDSAIQNLNGFFASMQSPLKLGGMFHVGVEIDGVEWSFGKTSSGTGVCTDEPRCNYQHHFRETLRLPCTQLSFDETAAVLQELQLEYQGADYDILQRNCCHFAQDLCERLGVGPLPRWINRFAYLGDCIDQTTLCFAKLPLSESTQQMPAEDAHVPVLCDR